MKSICIGNLAYGLVLLIYVLCISLASNSQGEVEQQSISDMSSAVSQTLPLPNCLSFGRQVVTPENSQLRSALTRYEFKASLLYLPLMVRWASWIRLPNRLRRPYRNPLRPFRLHKKQRRRLEKYLFTLSSTELCGSLPTSKQLLSSQEWV